MSTFINKEELFNQVFKLDDFTYYEARRAGFTKNELQTKDNDYFRDNIFELEPGTLGEATWRQNQFLALYQIEPHEDIIFDRSGDLIEIILLQEDSDRRFVAFQKKLREGDL